MFVDIIKEEKSGISWVFKSDFLDLDKWLQLRSVVDEKWCSRERRSGEEVAQAVQK